MSSKTPQAKHRRIFETLREEVLSGRHARGQKLPTDKQLVQRFGVSRATVIRALRDLEQAQLVRRRMGAGTYVCGPANGTETGIFAILIEGYRVGALGIWGTVAAQVAHDARLLDRGIEWVNLPAPAEWNRATAEQICRELLSHNVAGIFFKPTPFVPPEQKGVNRELVERLADAGVAVLLLDFDVADYPDRSQFDVVGINNRRAGYRVAHHLLGLGARRIDFITIPAYPSTVVDRIRGCHEAMRDAGIEPHAEWVYQCDADCQRVMDALTQTPRVDALVATNDLTAITLLQGLTRRGVRVPEDVRMASFDDAEYAALVTPPLTTVRQPARAMGHLAVEVLQQRIAHRNMPPRDILMDCELVVRQSCGSPAPPPTS